MRPTATTQLSQLRCEDTFDAQTARQPDRRVAVTESESESEQEQEAERARERDRDRFIYFHMAVYNKLTITGACILQKCSQTDADGGVAVEQVVQLDKSQH